MTTVATRGAPDQTDSCRFDVGGGVSLAAHGAGPVDGVPLLMLHGGGQTRLAWGAAVDALAGRGLRAIAVDLRGHGESSWSPDGIYELDQFADDLRAVIGQLGRPPIVVGASLGGLSALLACGEKPQAPHRALVLVDIVPRMPAEAGEQIIGFMRGTAAGFDSLDQAADAIAAYLPHRARPSSTEGLAKNLRLGEDGRYYWRWDPRFVSPDRAWDLTALNHRLEAAARAITAPVLLIRGSRSELVSGEAANEMLRLIPHAQVREVSEARHMVAGDDNNAFLDALLEFVDGLPLAADQQSG